MAAKAILVAKNNSFHFEDRVLELSSPVRIGRSHKDDKSDSGNAIFDCKVLSRNHATILFDEDKFWIVDTGSSNGTFVNNIRLSKCGEESKVTELFSGDSLRFGSDVVDKARNVTQKCVVAKLSLYHPDGGEYDHRPVTSRLFRPDSSDDVKNGDNGGELISVVRERDELRDKISEMEKKLTESEQFCSSFVVKNERDATEITKLRLLVDTQNNDIANLETALNDTQNELDRAVAAAEADDKLASLRSHYETKMQEIEDNFAVLENKMQKQLEEAGVNESNLLDRIKTLESESGYAQAEVEKVAVKESCEFEYKQELEYKVECLSTELQHCKMMLEQAESSKVVERSEEDVKMIAEKDENIVKLKEEVSYYKKELIDARSRKAAAEDELNTVKGTVETINNSSAALSTEIDNLNLTITELNKKLDEQTTRADHLDNLVAAMESQPDVEARSKVEISDLKTELATAQQDLKQKLDEILSVKDKVREEQELVQQKEIEISRLNGRVQFVEEELELVKSESGDVSGLQAEINTLRKKLQFESEELETVKSDKAVEKLINKAAQCCQLQSQMSPLHKQSLQQSNKNQVHRASALAILNLLSPPLLLDLEHSLKTLTDWSGELRQVGVRWELAVRPPPGQGPRKCFIIEKKQLRELELDTVNNKCFYSSSFESGDQEMKLYFGSTFLTVPKSVFEEAVVEVID